MKQVDIAVMGSDPEAFYDMCVASTEPIYILENGEPTLVAMSEGLFERIRNAAIQKSDQKDGLD